MTEYQKDLVGIVISISEDKKYGIIKCGEDLYPFGYLDTEFNFELGQTVLFDGLYQELFLFAYNIREYLELEEKPYSKVLVKNNELITQTSNN